MTTYYVAPPPTGDDAHPGTEAEPWATLQKAANTVSAGDTVLVADGTYTRSGSEDLVYITANGSSGSRITFRSINKWGAKLDGAGQNKHCVLIGNGSNGNYITIQDFDIYGAAQINNNGCTAVQTYGDYTWIIGCKLHNIGNDDNTSDYGCCGVYSETADYLLVDSCLIYSCGRNLTTPKYHDHGIYVSSGDNGIVRNCIFHDNKSGWCIQLYPGGVGNLLTNWKILNNTFADNCATTGKKGQIITWCNLTNLDISNNISYDPDTGFISWQDGGTNYVYSNVTVRKNLIYNGIAHAYSLQSGITETDNITNTDPLFTDTANHDYRLQSGSQARDAGLTLSDVTDDIDGVSRPKGSAYDIGAYEYEGITPSVVITFS